MTQAQTQAQTKARTKAQTKAQHGPTAALPLLAYVEASLERMERDPHPDDAGLGSAQMIELLKHLVTSPPEGTSPEALMMDLLRVMRHHLRREPCAVLGSQEQLTTTQAAALLGVSRPTLIRYIERGQLHATQVGSHRRVLAAEVLRLRASLEQTAQAMEQLAALAQEDDLEDF